MNNGGKIYGKAGKAAWKGRRRSESVMSKAAPTVDIVPETCFPAISKVNSAV